MTPITIAYHGKCFDGMASAAVLAGFFRRHFNQCAPSFHFTGIDHQPGGSYVPDDVLDGQINAVVDFRYSLSEKLHWWFDHHETGLVGEEERDHFKEDRSGQKFFDPQYSSCCKFIAHVLKEHFAWHSSEFEPLIRWADKIDTASYRNAAEAVQLDHPVLQLMAVIEAFGDDNFLSPIITSLSHGREVEQIAESQGIQRLWQRVHQSQRQSQDLMRSRARVQAEVVFCDYADMLGVQYNKFLPYYLYPECRYAVVISKNPTRIKVSVGTNPWIGTPNHHNIGQICSRFGGGGHPVVGAVSLAADETARARDVAQQIVSLLSL